MATATATAMALPSFLLIEVRAAFRACCTRPNGFQNVSPFFALARTPARRAPTRFLHTSVVYRLPARRPTTTTTTTTTSATAATETSAKAATSVPHAQPANAPNSDPAQSGESSTQLIPSTEKEEALDTGRKADVPFRVVPPSRLSPTTKLLPQERLHIEHLTRHPPPKKKFPGFRETILIYHLGHLKVLWMIVFRLFLTSMAVTTLMIWVPAYYQWGAPYWFIGLVGLAAFIPPWFVTYYLRGVATEVRLKLPPSARESPKTAMSYARNLPKDATIHVRFLHWIGIPGNVTLRVGDTIPVSKKINIPAANFRWVGPRVDRGTWLLPNPTEFWVDPVPARGLATRATVPEIWQALYKRLTRLDPAPGRK